GLQRAFTHLLAGGGKIPAHLRQHILIARLLEVGGHHFLRISINVGAAQLLRHPPSEQPVPAGERLELLLLVELEFGFKAAFTALESIAHESPSAKKQPPHLIWARRLPG